MRTRQALAILGALIGVGFAVVPFLGVRSRVNPFGGYMVLTLLGVLVGGFAGFIIGIVAERLSPRYKLRRPTKLKDSG